MANVAIAADKIPITEPTPAVRKITVGASHGLRTPNEGINQRYLKNWADVADKICFGRT